MKPKFSLVCTECKRRLSQKKGLCWLCNLIKYKKDLMSKKHTKNENN